MQVHILFLLPMAFLLPSGIWAGEIIGGRDVWPHSRPHMAYLDIQVGAEEFFCGGFLVAKDFVLTAAHCQGQKIIVTLGAHKIRNRERTQQKIELAEPAKLNREVEVIALPCAGEEAAGRMGCRVAGWGRTIPDDDSSAANALREVDVEVLEDKECSKYYNYDSATMLCAGRRRKRRNSAEGDSGSPLVCGGKAHGIVSCGYDTPPPSLYTRVSPFLRWIQDEMGRLQA